MLRKFFVFMLGIGVALVSGGVLVSVQWRRVAIIDGQPCERSPLSTLFVVFVMIAVAALTMRVCRRRWKTVKKRGQSYNFKKGSVL